MCDDRNNGDPYKRPVNRSGGRLATSDGTASERSDFTTALGTLRFAAGETTKTFTVLVGEDSRVEGEEQALISLTNPTGGAILGDQKTATLEFKDDPTEPQSNVIEDARQFVCHHYHDFLNRQPDQSGLDFWTNEITSCGTDQGCIETKRINVSAAFFLSIEFQQTGFLVHRLHRASFGDLPRYRQFLRDTQEISRGVVVLNPAGKVYWSRTREPS